MDQPTQSSTQKLALWQWAILALPIIVIVGFVLIAAGVQIHSWGISWIWGVITLVFVGWRWLVVRWTQPLLKQLSGAIVDLQDELDSTLADRSSVAADADLVTQADKAVRDILATAQDDAPIWEDWPTFWQRCQQVVSAIAHLYYPDVKYPLLNIHIPQAYGLIRGTVDDMDVWMQKLSPVLNQVSVGQAYQAYEVYKKLEPSARKLGKVWNWARWLWNPAAAAAQTISQPYNNQATQQLLVNLSQSLREVALHTLGEQAIALYSGQTSRPASSAGGQEPIQNSPVTALPQSSAASLDPNPQASTSHQPQGTMVVPPAPPNQQRDTADVSPRSTVHQPSGSSSATATVSASVENASRGDLKEAQALNTKTIRAILDQAKPASGIVLDPVKILLIGRTGAGKSSVINTVFKRQKAVVDVLPSTDKIAEYRWSSVSQSKPLPPESSEDAAQEDTQLILWDTPGYEQANRDEFKQQILDQAQQADLVILVTPALDPSLQMDQDILAELKANNPDLPIFVAVTQVDRLRPVREWNPPYDWQWGTRAKERSIRDAIAYRSETLGDWCDQLLPLVTLEGATDGPSAESSIGRSAWNEEDLINKMLDAIAPAKQLRLARFLRDQELQARAIAQIINSYAVQMTTTQGMTAFLKSPVLKFVSTLTTGSADLAYLLEEQIPVEQLPLVIGKLQMAYDLFNALSPDRDFNLMSLWPLLLENDGGPRQNAAIFGHALVEHFSRQSDVEMLHRRFYQQLDTLTAQ